VSGRRAATGLAASPSSGRSAKLAAVRIPLLPLLVGLTLGGGCATPPAARPALVVASDLDNLPFAGVDADGRPIGRDVELMERLAAGIGRRVEWRRMPFAELLGAAERGEVDVVCATLGITPERAERVLFTRPYFETSIAVVVRAGPPDGGEPTTLAELAGRAVAAGAGTTSERAVRLRLPEAVGVFENERETPTEQRLAAREIDAAVMDGPAADALVAASGGRLVRLAQDLDRERYALALAPGRTRLKSQLDRELARLGP